MWPFNRKPIRSGVFIYRPSCVDVVPDRDGGYIVQWPSFCDGTKRWVHRPTLVQAMHFATALHNGTETAEPVQPQPEPTKARRSRK